MSVAVRSYAADYSVTLAEAQRRLDRIGPLQDLMAAIRDLEGARLAGWGIDHDTDFGAWLWPRVCGAAIDQQRMRLCGGHYLSTEEDKG